MGIRIVFGTPKPSRAAAPIECVTVCVDYADFLAHTLPTNKAMFDRIVVVTTPDDVDTQNICHWNNVRCVLEPRIKEVGKFWKGRGINAGLRTLQRDGWMVHLDADVLLPARFREHVDRADFDRTSIYGADRLLFHSYEEYERFRARPLTQHIHSTFVSNRGRAQGSRLVLDEFAGWVPVGYFQLWHADSKVDAYPEGDSSAAHGDAVFAAQWPRGRRAFIPDFFVYHLESEAAPSGANWRGRKTIRFGPEPSATIEEAAWAPSPLPSGTSDLPGSA